MPPEGLDDLYEETKRLGRFLSELYKDVTGDDLDLESGIRHYPLVALGLAAGAGATAQWWYSRRRQRSLPPPEASKQFGTMVDSLWQAGAALMPDGVDRLRRVLPDIASEQAGEQVRTWVDSYLEPAVKRGLENVVTNASESRLGQLFLRSIEALNNPEETELEDPQEPPRD